MPRLTPNLAKSRSRPAPAARQNSDATTAPDRRRFKAVPLASLPLPQRRLISALLEAASAAAIRRGIAADSNAVVPGEITGNRVGGAR
jgi:hypothetical protein